MIVIALLVILAVLVGVDEWDRHQRPRRFGVGLRRCVHPDRPNPRPWRWTLRPLFTPATMDQLVRDLGDVRTAGRARTYLGAVVAGLRARRQLERRITEERQRFVTDLLERDRFDELAARRGLRVTDLSAGKTTDSAELGR